MLTSPQNITNAENERLINESIRCKICKKQSKLSDKDPMVHTCACSDPRRSLVHRRCLMEWRNLDPENHLFYNCHYCSHSYHISRAGWASWIDSVWVKSVLTILIILSLLIAFALVPWTVYETHNWFLNRLATSAAVTATFGAALIVCAVLHDLFALVANRWRKEKLKMLLVPSSALPPCDPVLLVLGCLLTVFIAVFLLVWRVVEAVLDRSAQIVENVPRGKH